jgi:hypothetical protein
MAALPLNLPADLASVTVPVAFVPLGITTLSPTTTGCAKEASKRSPGLLSFELTAWSAVTTISVPAGTTIGFGEKAREIADSEEFWLLDPRELSATPEFASVEVESGEVAELWHPTRVRENKPAIMRERAKALCLIVESPIQLGRWTNNTSSMALEVPDFTAVVTNS